MISSGPNRVSVLQRNLVRGCAFFMHVLLLDIASQLNGPISLTSAPVDHPMIAWKQSELFFGDLMLPSLRAWFFGSVDSPEADAGSLDAEALICPGPIALSSSPDVDVESSSCAASCCSG